MSGIYHEQDLIGNDGLIARFDYDSGTVPIYIGKAKPGTGEDELGWRIMKLTYDGNDNITAINFASSSNGYAFEWDERASYTYG